MGACWDGNTFYVIMSFGITHVILKTITRTRMLKGGGFGLTAGHIVSSLHCWISLVVVMCVCIFHCNDGTRLIPR